MNGKFDGLYGQAMPELPDWLVSSVVNSAQFALGKVTGVAFGDALDQVSKAAVDAFDQVRVATVQAFDPNREAAAKKLENYLVRLEQVQDLYLLYQEDPQFLAREKLSVRRSQLNLNLNRRENEFAPSCLRQIFLPLTERLNAISAYDREYSQTRIDSIEKLKQIAPSDKLDFLEAAKRNSAFVQDTILSSNLEVMSACIDKMGCYTEEHHKIIETFLTCAEDILTLHESQSTFDRKIEALRDEIAIIIKELRALEGFKKAGSRTDLFALYVQIFEELNQSFRNLVAQANACADQMMALSQIFETSFNLPVTEVVPGDSLETAKQYFAALDTLSSKVSCFEQAQQAYRSLAENITSWGTTFLEQQRVTKEVKDKLRSIREDLIEKDKQNLANLCTAFNDIFAAEDHVTAQLQEQRAALERKGQALVGALSPQDLRKKDVEGKLAAVELLLVQRTKYLKDSRSAFANIEETVRSLLVVPYSNASERATYIQSLTQQLADIKIPLVQHNKGIAARFREAEKSLIHANKHILSEKIIGCAKDFSHNIDLNIELFRRILQKNQWQRSWKKTMVNFFMSFVGEASSWSFIQNYKEFEAAHLYLETQITSLISVRTTFDNIRDQQNELLSSRKVCLSFQNAFNVFYQASMGVAQGLKTHLSLLELEKASPKAKAPLMDRLTNLHPVCKSTQEEGLVYLSHLEVLLSPDKALEETPVSAGQNQGVDLLFAIEEDDVKATIKYIEAGQHINNLGDLGSQDRRKFWMNVLVGLSNKSTLLNVLDRNDNTLLHAAIIAKDLVGVNTLLALGAKVDIKNDAGQTALDTATSLWREEAFSYQPHALKNATEVVFRNNPCEIQQIYDAVKRASEAIMVVEKENLIPISLVGHGDVFAKRICHAFVPVQASTASVASLRVPK